MFYLFYHDFSYRFSQYEWQILQGLLNGKFGDWRVAVYDVIFDKPRSYPNYIENQI